MHEINLTRPLQHGRPDETLTDITTPAGSDSPFSTPKHVYDSLEQTTN